MHPYPIMRKHASIIVAFLLAGLPVVVRAIEVPDVVPLRAPLWETGLFSAYGWIPDYPAARQNHFHGIVLPYFIYRGSLFRSDREGARAQVQLLHNLYLEFSAAGSFPVDSKDNGARQGMPDLDWIGEIGPRLAWKMFDFGERGKLKLLLPMRAVFSTDFKENINYRGLVFPPAISFNSYNFLHRDWIGLIEIISSFGGRRMNAYFYEVAPRFALPDRPMYDAQAGYLNTKLFVGVAMPFWKRFHYFNGMSLAFNQGSANQDSPLYKNSTNFTWIMAVSWRWLESAKTGVQ